MNMNEHGDRCGGRRKGDSHESDIFIEEASMELERNLELEKFPENQRMTPKAPSNSEECWEQ